MNVKSAIANFQLLVICYAKELIHSQGFHPGSFRKKISEENGRDGENKEVKYQRKRKQDTGHCQIQEKNQEINWGK